MNSVSMLGAEEQAELAASGVPIVLLNRSTSNPAFSTVRADNEAGGALAARYLLGLGHRKIAHLTGPRQHGNLSDRARRIVLAVRSAKRPVRPVVLHGEFSFTGGTGLMEKLPAEHRDVTAVFTADDVMAFGALRTAIAHGLRIPQDVSLIGFDNLEFSGIVHPPLTTIHRPKYEMGYVVVEALLRLTRDKHRQIPEHHLLGVERESCRAL
jgi:DNA-binding LacI/PurR family transcriptional regulator